MKNSVLRYRERQASILMLEPSVQEGIRQLGMTAAVLLAQQDVALWAQASDGDFHNKLSKGAAFLGRIGREKGPEVLVQDSASHHAFITCLFLASQADQLCLQCRTDLRITLLILAECCPVDLPIKHLPAPAELHAGLRRQSIMRKHYPAMQRAGSTYLITLADALRLLVTMERAPAVGLVPLLTDLREVTEGLRTALQKTAWEKP